MNLGQIRAEALAHGFDPTFYGSSRIDQYINDAYQFICRRVQYYADEAVYDFPTVSGTATYSQPADFAKDRELRDTARNVVLVCVGLMTIDRSTVASGAPNCYAIDATNLHLYPTPNGAYPLELRYWKVPAPLVNDADTPTIPADYHRMLWYWAVKERYASDDNQQTAQYWETQFSNALSAFAADQKFPSTDTPNQIADMWAGPPTVSAGEWHRYGY